MIETKYGTVPENVSEVANLEPSNKPIQMWLAIIIASLALLAKEIVAIKLTGMPAGEKDVFTDVKATPKA